MPHRKLLLADDSITIRRVVELMFAGEDVEVLAVTDGEEAIARISSDRPDIVLADIRMPKRTGYDVATFMKERPDLEHIPILLLAGVFEPVDEVLVRRARVDGVLIKPFEPRHVVARVRELWGGRREFRDAEGFATVAPADEPPAPGAPAPESRPAEPLAGESAGSGAVASASSSRSRSEMLTDYFDELATAIAARERSRATSPGDSLDVDENVPTLDAILARGPARVDDHSETGRRPELRESAFSRHADASEHDDGAVGMPPASEPQEASAGLEMATSHTETADALVEYVTRQVIERLAPDAAHAVVSQVVAEIAERLVREEIAKIRAGGPKPVPFAARPEPPA